MLTQKSIDTLGDRGGDSDAPPLNVYREMLTQKLINTLKNRGGNSDAPPLNVYREIHYN